MKAHVCIKAYTNVIPHLFVIAPNWEQCKSTSEGEWINKLCYIYISTAYYCAAIKSELLLQTIIYMNCKIILLSERSHSRRVHAALFHLHKMLENPN